jgi:clan AA aspartic protease (TIGR02281 family)
MLSRHKSAHILGAVWAGLAVCGCQGGKDAGHCTLAHVTDLKLERRGNGFFTTIAINGHSAELLFDTGSADSLLLETTARRLGLSVVHYNTGSVEGIGGTRDVGQVHAREVRLGDARGEDLGFLTTPENAGDADGILGMNFLFQFDLDLDFWGQRIGLYKGLGGCNSPATAMTGSLYAVDLAPEPSNAQYGSPEQRSPLNLSPAVYVTINGERLRAVIDTGASHTMIFRDSARRAGLGEGDVLERTNLHGVGRRVVRAEMRLSAPVVIGELTVQNMPVLVADQRHPKDADMLLGYDFVTRVHVWVSRSSGTVIMQYPPHSTATE